MFQFFWTIHQVGMGAGPVVEVAAPPVVLAIVGRTGQGDSIRRTGNGDKVGRAATSDKLTRRGGGRA